ncbi:hypothetical protein GQ457_02G022010 [Hibiscus cannabinus]
MENEDMNHLCFCGLPCDLRTAWSSNNPGRRFFGCKNYGKSRFQSSCNFFRWHDPPITARQKIVVLRLLKKINRMEREIKKERIVWMVILVGLGMIAWSLKWN